MADEGRVGSVALQVALLGLPTLGKCGGIAAQVALQSSSNKGSTGFIGVQVAALGPLSEPISRGRVGFIAIQVAWRVPLAYFFQGAQMSTHNSIVGVNVERRREISAADFPNKYLRILNKATDTLGGSTVVTVTSQADVDTLLDDGEISAATATGLTAAFAADTPPPEIKLAWIDTAATETYAAAIARIAAVDEDWYVVGTYARTAAAVIALSNAMQSFTTSEGYKKLCIVQSATNDWFEDPFDNDDAINALVGNSRTIPFYHTTDTTYIDILWPTQKLLVDPSVESVPWGWPVYLSDTFAPKYSSLPTKAQRDIAVDTHHINMMLKATDIPKYILHGTTFGRDSSTGPIYIHEMVTDDWFVMQVKSRLVSLKAQHDAAHHKLTVDAVGAQKGQEVIQAVLNLGVEAGHFSSEPDQVRVRIASINTSTSSFTYTISAKYASNVRTMTVNANFGRDNITVERVGG